MKNEDIATAQAFANSWNNLPSGSVYTRAQFEDWMAPLTTKDFAQARVLELGCGNGSLLVHACEWRPASIVGVDLGASVQTARHNVAVYPYAKIEQDDLVSYRSIGFEIVYCIGVLHHLKAPQAGFVSVVENTQPGGKFHCWVYAREGNAIVIYLVDPIRKIASRLPWWVTKYLIATPLVVPYFVYAKTLSWLAKVFPSTREILAKLPLFDYSLWIAQRGFLFFRHVAFDQLVTPQTVYLSRLEVQKWLSETAGIDQSSTYIIARNGNSWKFGGHRVTAVRR